MKTSEKRKHRWAMYQGKACRNSWYLPVKEPKIIAIYEFIEGLKVRVN